MAVGPPLRGMCVRVAAGGGEHVGAGVVPCVGHSPCRWGMCRVAAMYRRGGVGCWWWSCIGRGWCVRVVWLFSSSSSSSSSLGCCAPPAASGRRRRRTSHTPHTHHPRPMQLHHQQPTPQRQLIATANYSPCKALYRQANGAHARHTEHMTTRCVHPRASQPVPHLLHGQDTSSLCCSGCVVWCGVCQSCASASSAAFSSASLLSSTSRVSVARSTIRFLRGKSAASFSVLWFYTHTAQQGTQTQSQGER